MAVVVVAVVVAVAVAVAAVALPHRELAPVGHLFVLQSVAINSIGKPRQKPNPGRAADDRRIAALEQKNLTSHHSSGRVSPCPSGLHPLSFLPIECKIASSFDSQSLTHHPHHCHSSPVFRPAPPALPSTTPCLAHEDSIARRPPAYCPAAPRVWPGKGLCTQEQASRLC